LLPIEPGFGTSPRFLRVVSHQECILTRSGNGEALGLPVTKR
jgi:hypothetical protein